MKKNNFNKSILAVSLALLLVLLLVVAVFIFGRSGAKRVKITLPEKQKDESKYDDAEINNQEGVLLVTPDNAVAVLTSLDRPSHYHQIFSAEIGSDPVSSYIVELWINGVFRHAKVSGPYWTKHLICDETTVWIWYDGNDHYSEFPLNAETCFEDLIALPAFNYVGALQASDITETEYLVIEEDQSQIRCVFLSTQTSEDTCERFWISLDSGLLYVADAMERSVPVYQIRQLAFDRLAPQDEAFSGKFVLPDSTDITTVKTNMPPQQ